VHGTAPDIAGKGLANPTALVQSAVMMLHHIGEDAAAQKIERCLVALYKEGNVKTGDLGGSATTDQFTDALCKAVSA